MKWTLRMDWSLGGTVPMTDCVKSSSGGGHIGLNITKAPRHLYDLFRGVPACVLWEYPCRILFLLSGYLQHWGKCLVIKKTGC